MASAVHSVETMEPRMNLKFLTGCSRRWGIQSGIAMIAGLSVDAPCIPIVMHELFKLVFRRGQTIDDDWHDSYEETAELALQTEELISTTAKEIILLMLKHKHPDVARWAEEFMFAFTVIIAEHDGMSSIARDNVGSMNTRGLAQLFFEYAASFPSISDGELISWEKELHYLLKPGRVSKCFEENHNDRDMKRAIAFAKLQVPKLLERGRVRLQALLPELLQGGNNDDDDDDSDDDDEEEEEATAAPGGGASAAAAVSEKKTFDLTSDANKDFAKAAESITDQPDAPGPFTGERGSKDIPSFPERKIAFKGRYCMDRRFDGPKHKRTRDFGFLGAFYDFSESEESRDDVDEDDIDGMLGKSMKRKRKTKKLDLVTLTKREHDHMNADIPPKVVKDFEKGIKSVVTKGMPIRGAVEAKYSVKVAAKPRKKKGQESEKISLSKD